MVLVVWIFEIGFVEVDGIFDVFILGYRSFFFVRKTSGFGDRDQIHEGFTG